MTEPFATHKNRVVIPSQSDKFKQAAREAGCSENEAAWEEMLKKLAKQRPGKTS